jgi:hypothetical protein
MAFKKKHFAFQHPVFGRSSSQKKTKPFKNSVYYFWYEFLKRNENYKECCRQGGLGAMADLYADFGDVFEMDFKSWWQENDRGARLFAEAPLPSVRQIKEADDLEVSDRMLTVSLPLELPRKFLEAELKKLLDKHHKGERGVRTNKESTALYPVVGHFDMTNLSKCLTVFDLRKERPDLKLWQLCQEARVGSRENYIKEGQKDLSAANKKIVLANSVKRYIKAADAMVANVGLGKFPGVRF